MPVPFDRFFARRWQPDDLGFLDVDHSPDLFPAEHLFEHAAVIVVGPPWMGKTRVARRLVPWLQDQQATYRFGERLCLTEFGVYGSERTVPPPWWDDWHAEPVASPACWIIDALDEGEERSVGVAEKLLQELEVLGPGHRRSLHLLVFSRQRDWLPEFRGRLGKLYGFPDLRDLPEFQLAPLHREAARQLVEQEVDSAPAFDRVLDVVRQFKLESVAGCPAALRYICHHTESGNLSVATVWRGVLLHLFNEPDRGRRPHVRTEVDERFEAGARMAAVLTLTGHDEVFMDQSGRGNLPTLADVFPIGADGRSMRQAAREACQMGPLCCTPEGGYTFLHRNVRDWLAAFGLADLSLGALRPALAGPDGRPAERHRELLPLLRHVSRDPDVRDWIDSLSGGLPFPSDLVWPSLVESRACLDRLEQIADESPDGTLSYSVGLERLAAPGLGGELAERLRDPSRSPAVKDLLLSAAIVTDARPVLPVAVEIACDATQPSELRRSALYVVEAYGGNADFLRLAVAVARTAVEDRTGRRLQAAVIRHLLERRLWTVPEAVAHAPPSEPHYLDDRLVVWDKVQELMTASDARLILRDRHRTGTRLRGIIIDRRRQLDPISFAAHVLVKHDALDESDQFLLAEVALEHEVEWKGLDLASELVGRPDAVAAVRRRFYEHGISLFQRTGSPARQWGLGLTCADLDWLHARSLGEWSTVPHVWMDLYFLGRRAFENGEVSSEDWQALGRDIERYAPGTAARLEEGREEYERSLRQHNEEMAEYARQNPVLHLSHSVDELLSRQDLAPAERMRHLSALCFATALRPPNFVGEWDELDSERQERVLDACQSGLDAAEPTPLPDQNSYSGEILADGVAFAVIFRDPARAGWVDKPRLRRWLPTALFVVHEHLSDLVDRAGKLDSALTLELLLNAAERELRAGFQSATRAWLIPEAWWTEEVAARVVGWTRDDAFPVEARTNLLELLALRFPSAATPLARAWSQLARDPDEAAIALRHAGVDCLLVLEPDRVITVVEEMFRQEGRESLKRFGSLHGGRHLRVNLAGWPVERLEALGRILYEAFPTADDPDYSGAHWVTAEDELRNTRGSVVAELLRREAGGAEALARLANADVGLRQWLDNNQARRKASAAVAGLVAAKSFVVPSIPTAEAVRLLDQADYRLVRSADDLLQAVCEVLRRIDRDIAADLPMLYSSPGLKNSEASGSRKHLGEDAIQAYVRRRLTDLLPALIQGAEVVVVREDQVRYRRRLDLRVVAPCLGGKETATVVLELKWSDNRETEAGLEVQLGRKYLLGEGLTHGVYLVAWCGHWHRKGSGRQNDRISLESHLDSQVGRYCGQGPGKGLTIRPLVLGAEWHDPAD